MSSELSQHEYLLSLDGFKPGEGQVGDTYVFLPEEIPMLQKLLRDWLPSQLESLNLPGSIAMDEDIYVDKGFKYHGLKQRWGEAPNEASLKNVGKIIEFGGPTESMSGFMLDSFSPDLVTNINTQIGPVDMLADATSMPFKTDSLGGVFISCLPGATRNMAQKSKDTRKRAIIESSRVLKKGGRLIWLGGTVDDFEDIISLGFKPEALEVEAGYYEAIRSGDYLRPTLKTHGIFLKDSLTRNRVHLSNLGRISFKP